MTFLGRFIAHRIPLFLSSERLIQDIGHDLDDMEATKLEVTTTAQGASMGMLPNPKAQVFNEAFNATFWIETVNGEHGKVKYQQLQYAQTVNMDFKVKFKPHCQTSNAPLDCLIKWPHVQVNTLRKLPPFDPCEIYTCAEGLPPIR
eukprot:TRINITY_DN21268_c0_g1_i1.p2 TRINITY_DN21268_c0_g1~~TRINITY_DN21268_c0_g1_i1.p2  ORF type:complete len:146 (+),score=20.78 TRINITY_DN21268_c0_g1_i1:48-485(+)